MSNLEQIQLFGDKQIRQRRQPLSASQVLYIYYWCPLKVKLNHEKPIENQWVGEVNAYYTLTALRVL